MTHLTKFGKFLVGGIIACTLVAATLVVVARTMHQDEAIAAAQPVAEEAAPAPAAGGGSTLFQQNPSDIVMGDPNAPVTIIEYASLSCSHCAHFHNDILPELEKAYISTGKAKLIHRPFSLNAPALKGAMLAGCAGKDRYYAFLKVMFEKQAE